jgi:hypothetical protein
MIIPDTTQINEDMIKENKYLLESFNIMAFNIGSIMNNPTNIITQAI